MPNTEDQIKKSEPWSLKSKNASQKTTSVVENQGTNRPGTKNPSVASKTAPKEGAIVDVITRNRSHVNERPFDTEKENLSQKAGKRINKETGGKTMDSFSVTTQAKINRNATITKKELGTVDASGQISKGKTSTKLYPKRGANATGRNSG